MESEMLKLGQVFRTVQVAFSLKPPTHTSNENDHDKRRYDPHN